MQRDEQIEWRILLLFLVLALLTLIAAAPVQSTPELTASSPEAGGRVESVTEIRLWFSAPPEIAVSMILLVGSEGRIALGEVHAADDNALVAAVPTELAPGEYTVSWRTSSGDGQPIRCRFSFRVAAAG